MSIIFSAHPDDVEFGMGATLASLKDVHVVISFFFTESRQEEARRSLSILGVSPECIHFTQAKELRDLVRQQDVLMDTQKPKSIFTHFYGDSHQEHRAVQEAAIASSRKIPNASILLWENNQPGAKTHESFRPILYNPVRNEQIEQKIQALREHGSQMVKYDVQRLEAFLRNKAQVRGQECGSEFAEVFETFKFVTTF